MKFGVVVCPECMHAKGVDLSKKTSRCPHCGYILHVKKLKILFETVSQRELQQAIGILNAKLD